MQNTPSNTGMVPTATHIGYLAGMLAKTSGPVMELGTGHYSTMLLHHICKGRPIMSVDTDREWMEFFQKRYETDDHRFICTENRLISDYLRENLGQRDALDVVFVDHSPAPDRVMCVELLRHHARFIVVHDSEANAAAYGWNGIFDTFKYQLTCPFFSDSTTVVSEFEEIGL